MDDNMSSFTQILALVISACGFVTFIYIALRTKLIAEAINAMNAFEDMVGQLSLRDIEELFNIPDDEPVPLWGEELLHQYHRLIACAETVVKLEFRIELLLWVGMALPWLAMVILELFNAGIIDCGHLLYLGIVAFLILYVFVILGNLEPKQEDYKSS